MEFEPVLKIIVNYGFGIVAAVVMAIYLSKLLNRVMTQSEIREQKLAEIISKDITATRKAIEDHDIRMAASIKTIEEAHRRQREEHDAQREAWKKIEEENERRREAQAGIIGTLGEIGAILNIVSQREIHMQSKSQKVQK